MKQSLKNTKPLVVRTMVISLPVALATWNVVLAMNPWQRKKVRDLLHRFVSVFTPSGKASLTLTEYQQKRLLMVSDIAEYYRMIRPRRLPKSGILRKRTGKNPQLSPSAKGLRHE